MDRGPYRAPQQAGRPAARPAVQTRSEESHANTAVVRPATTSHHAVKDKKSKKAAWLPYVIGGIVVVLAAAGWFAWQALTADDGIDKSKYQYLKLSNGEEYYGKLAVLDGHNFKLTYVFYIKAQDDGTASSAKDEVAKAQSNLQLIKMGNEVHGPEDAMIINRDQVLFYENLKADGKVSQTINQYKDKQ